MHSPEQVRIPTWLSAAIFWAKASLLRCKRGLENRAAQIRRYPQVGATKFRTEVARSTTALWTDPTPAEMWYQRGKVQNLRLAAARLDRTLIPAGAVFSFWVQVGRASRFKGYVRGRMLQEGCIIPAIGGGLCQLSNALYQVALAAGCEIVERHPHSRIVPGSATAENRDATVAWNYVDLRFRAREPLLLQVRLTPGELHVSLLSGGSEGDCANRAATLPAQSPSSRVLPIYGEHACDSCGQETCFRSDSSLSRMVGDSRKAFLLDAAWPEFAAYVATNHSPQDVLAIPIDGSRWNQRQYAWPTSGFAIVKTAAFSVLSRSLRSRHLAAQGSVRQQALLRASRHLGGALARCLDEHIDEVCISQNLLPFLWECGVLGGRKITVLCTQLPLRELHAALDRAHKMHPESTTLADFRADDWIVAAELEALHYANRIVTPHRQVAALFSGKSQLLDWELPKPLIEHSQIARSERTSILFPSSTLGRKGAYELREALSGLDVRLLLGGPVIEDPQFWDGFDVELVTAAQGQRATMVVQPSIVESQPRALLQALVCGIPAITTESCGLQPMDGIELVAPMDAHALRIAILKTL